MGRAVLACGLLLSLATASRGSAEEAPFTPGDWCWEARGEGAVRESPNEREVVLSVSEGKPGGFFGAWLTSVGGDFDVSVRVDLLQWEPRKDSAVALGLVVEVIDASDGHATSVCAMRGAGDEGGSVKDKYGLMVRRADGSMTNADSDRPVEGRSFRLRVRRLSGRLSTYHQPLGLSGRPGQDEVAWLHDNDLDESAAGLAAACLMFLNESDRASHPAARVRFSDVRVEGDVLLAPAERVEQTILKGDFEGAGKELRVLDEAGHPGCALLHAQLCLRKGDKAGADKWLSDARRSNPKVAQQGYDFACRMVDAKQWDRALLWCDTVEALDPTAVAVHFTRGQALAGLGQKAEAIAAYGRYLQVDSTSDWAEKARRAVEELRR